MAKLFLERGAKIENGNLMQATNMDGDHEELMDTMIKKLNPLPDVVTNILYHSVTQTKEKRIKVLLAHGATVRISY